MDPVSKAEAAKLAFSFCMQHLSERAGLAFSVLTMTGRSVLRDAVLLIRQREICVSKSLCNKIIQCAANDNVISEAKERLIEYLLSP